MLLKPLALAALPLAALAQNSNPSNLKEEFGGHTFIKSGPKTLLPKETYELTFARAALRILKTALSPESLIDALQPEIKKADDFWHAAIDKSSGAWSPLADLANSDANPEHYVKRTREVPGRPGVLESEIMEGWGGVTTHFTIPNYGAPDRKAHPFLRELPEFPFQASGDKVLMDGTVFDVLHISVRDVKGEDFGVPEEGSGVEVFASVWYEDGVDDAHLEDERQHITVEIINLSLQAQRDIESGAFNPPI